MSKLNPGGLRKRQFQLVLKMLVHHIDHSIAEAPQEEKRADQNESVEVILAVGSGE